jgi:hypothetical protein
MMRCSGGGAGRRSAAGPGESASSRFCAPGGRADGGAAPFVGGRLGVPGRGSAGGFEGVPGRMAFDAFEGDIADEAFEGDIADEAFELGAPGRIDGELVSAPGRMLDESFDEPPPRIDDGIFVGPLGGVPSRGGDGLSARDDSFSLVWPAHVSSTGGGGGNAGALSRNTFVDVMSGTPSLRGVSRRGDDISCWANGDVMSTVDVGFGSTRVAEESK